MFIRSFISSVKTLYNTPNDHSFRSRLVSLSFFASVLLLSVGIFTSAVVLAWFTKNGQVDASGQNILVKTKESLIISTTEEGAIDQQISAGHTSVSLNINSSLTGATHDSDATKYPNLLKALNKASSSYVCVSTGIATSKATYIPAVEGTHFVEADVYLGAAVNDYLYESLSVTFSGSADVIAANSSYKSASVDIYLVTNDETPYYKGSMNLTTSGQSVDIFTVPGSISPSEPVHVKMRFYFDGALTETVSGKKKAILRSTTISLGSLNATVSFSAPHTDS